jgi:TolB-like protein/class 3 adenylate cyclase/Tfp pilus assembly protein PilF
MSASFSGGSPNSQRRLAAIVFTDIVGYSARMQRDEHGTLAAVQADFSRMGEVCAQHDGEVLNTMGDGMLLCFGSAVQAVACALALQAEFARRPPEALQHRIGIHLGDVFRQTSGGVAGDGVNLAARLQTKAPPGGVCVSQTVYDTVKGKLPMQARFIGPESFKNIAEPIPIWHLAAEGAEIHAGGRASATSGTGVPPVGSGNRGRDARATVQIPDYDLVRKIGEGGYGEVWLARGVTGAWRAVKLVWRNRFPDAEPFEREFRGVTKAMALPLREAGALALHHVGRNDAAGFFYYVMELADDASRGADLDPARYVPLTLKEVRARRGRLPAAECIALGAELARGLAALHARGLVHRDIKPSNLVIVNGAPKLADIGLVAPSASAHTFVGTEGFVPPEGPGTPAADVYALGKVLYELATGQDRADYPKLPDTFADAAERAAFFRLNPVLLRACAPVAAQRYPDAAALGADLAALAAGQAPRRSRSAPQWAMGAAGVGVALAAAAAIYFVRPDPPREAGPANVAKVPAESARSIAVLPFASLSEDGEASAFFADGVHEDILTNLGLVRDLRVVSRTSVLAYRATTKPTRDIGAELGVAYLLQGSVRRAGDRVRVTGQLIDARADRQIWAESYDRKITDIFVLQAELAQAIAGALRTALSPEEKALLARQPTANPAAYDLYLRGRSAQATGRPGKEVVEPLRKALELDPNFAVAWAELASFHSKMYHYNGGDANLAQAKAAIETAVRLGPDDPLVVQALGDYHYRCHRDYVRATEQYLRLLKLRPNDATMHSSLALLQRRQGRWEEALANAREAYRLDPKDGPVAFILGTTLQMMRRYDEAEAHARALVKEAPDNFVRAELLGRTVFYARGSRTETEALWGGNFGGERAAMLANMRWWNAAAIGDWATFLRMDPEQRTVPNMGAPVWQKVLIGAVVLADTGDPAGARQRADDALTLMRAEEERRQTDANWWGNLALAHALKGEKADALRYADRALGLSPPARDMLEYARTAELRASVLGRVGEIEAALDELARLLRLPDGANVHRARHGNYGGVSFQPLRGHPRFEALLADPANNAPLPVPEAPVPAAGATPPPARLGPRSLAVLPLENLSADPAHAFFTDGLHAELIATLQRIPQLRVIARDSAITLRRDRAPLHELAARAGVAHIVTGSVRRAGDRARIVLELRRAHDEALLWTQTYDRTLEDVFGVQSEVAAEVARILQAREARTEAEWAKFFTRNARAMDAYLQAIRITGRSYREQAETIALLDEALRADPEFLPAVAGLSFAHTTAARVNADPVRRPQHREAAKRHAEDYARRLPGGAGEEPLGFFATMLERDPEKGLAHFDSVISVLPNSSQAHLGRAIALGMAGRAAEADDALHRAVELDPFTESAWSFRLVVLATLRRVRDWEAAAAHVGGFAPHVAQEGRVALQRFVLTGELPAGIAQMPPTARAEWLRLTRDHARALADVEQLQAGPNVRDDQRFFLQLRRHDALRGLGRTAEAQAVAAELLPDYRRQEAEGKTFAEMKERTMSEILLRLGRTDEAVAARERYAGAVSPRAAQTDRWGREADLARFYARAGRAAACVARLRDLLRLPTGLTVTELKLDPDFDAVREDPAFRALLADPANAGPLPSGSDGRLAADLGARPGFRAAPAITVPAVVPVPPAPPAAPTPAQVEAAKEGKTLVVLPLRSLGADPDLGVLADGLHEDIIATVSGLADLKVISRTSALAFKGSTLSLAEIGQKTGADHALSGSVRKTGDALRIQMDLRRTRDEALLWQNTFSFASDAGLAVQERIAGEVAGILQARATKGSWAGAKFMTTNEEAYRLFAKARVLHGVQRPGLATFEEQIRLCTESLKLDPNFMQAANLLSISYSYAYRTLRGDPTDEKRKRYGAEAKRWAEISSKLAPGGAGDGAFAVYYSSVERDPVRLFAYAENEVRALPNDANGHNRVASSLQEFGRHHEALAAYERALELDPQNFRTLHNWTLHLAWLRRLPEFEAAVARTLGAYGKALDPRNYSWFHFQLTGKVPDTLEGLWPSLHAKFLYVERKFDTALAILEEELRKPDLAAAQRISLLFQQAEALIAAGRREAAAKAAEAALLLIEQLKPEPEADQADYDRRRMWAFTYLGREAEALAVARRYVAAIAPTGVVSERLGREVSLAEVCAYFGRAEECTALLAKLLRVPVPGGVTVPALRTVPVWDGVRDDPRFQALLADPKNSEPF